MTEVLIMCVSTIYMETLAQGFFFFDCEDRLAQGKLDKHLGEFERAGEPLKKEPNCWT